MEMDASTLTRNLQPLVARGWAKVGPGEDGRSRRVSVTAAGREKRAEAKRTWKKAQLAFNARLGTALVGRLHAALDECLALMGESPDSGE
jgi:DNA-binding MarR family transcriptional regulator